MIWIVDTTVIFSGLLARRPESPPVQVLTRVLARDLPILLSPALWAEYLRTLSGSKLAHALGGSVEHVGPILGRLWDVTQMVTPLPARESAPDPKDQHLWDLLGAVTPATLITGERRLLESRDFPDRVLTPRAALERLALV